MKNTTKSNSNKITTLILATAFSSLIITGCSSTSGSFSAANVSTATVMAAPVDQSQFNSRPDTHPELRSGLWQTSSKTQARVIEAPTVENQNPEAADTTQLLAYNPAVINAASSEELAAGAVITEAAGAQREQDLENYRLSIEERVRQENLNK